MKGGAAQMNSGPLPRRRPADLVTAAMSRGLRLGRRRYPITIEPAIPVPMRDGAILLADHYAPAGAPTEPAPPTVLMRGPYGRGPQFAVGAWPLAERGYHVLLQSTRGTFGSGGRFTPAVDEAADGQDTVAWLRDQPWFSGQLALVGASYLAYTAWVLAADPPPELTAMALYISPHDLAAAGFGHGPFELYNLLSWSDLVASQERMGAVRMLWRTMTAERRLAAAMSRLPIVATGAHLDGDAPWYREWLAHPDRSDPYWDAFSATAALERVTVPTLLVSGFHDFFVEQTVQQYRALRARGVPTRLTIGPWAHLTLDLSVAMRETIAWLDAYASGARPAQPPRGTPVRVWTTGQERWRELPDWPPAGTTALTWYLRAGRRLAEAPADDRAHADIARGSGFALAIASANPLLSAQSPGDEAAFSAFRYDPADPTPSVGGRVMSMRNSGSQDNSAVEARADVLIFSTPPLPAPVEVAGVPLAELYLTSDSPYCDVFVRLCDVDERGRSRNLTDQIHRCSPADVTPGEVRRLRLPLTDVSHVFQAGHRIRLQVAGGAHPRFARNLGTDSDQVHGTMTASVTHEIQHNVRYPSALILPVATQPVNAPGR
jgi:uncharacterized protein